MASNGDRRRRGSTDSGRSFLLGAQFIDYLFAVFFTFSMVDAFFSISEPGCSNVLWFSNAFFRVFLCGNYDIDFKFFCSKFPHFGILYFDMSHGTAQNSAFLRVFQAQRLQWALKKFQIEAKTRKIENFCANALKVNYQVESRNSLKFWSIGPWTVSFSRSFSSSICLLFISVTAIEQKTLVILCRAFGECWLFRYTQWHYIIACLYFVIHIQLFSFTSNAVYLLFRATQCLWRHYSMCANVKKKTRLADRQKLTKRSACTLVAISKRERAWCGIPTDTVSNNRN